MHTDPSVPHQSKHDPDMPAKGRPVKDFGRAICRWLSSGFEQWQRNRLIVTLEAMDEHMLRDIGIRRKDIPLEADKILAPEETSSRKPTSLD